MAGKAIKIPFQPTVDFTQFQNSIAGMQKMLNNLKLGTGMKQGMENTIKAIENIQKRIEKDYAGKILNQDEVKTVNKLISDLNKSFDSLRKKVSQINVNDAFDLDPGVLNQLSKYNLELKKADDLLKNAIKNKEKFLEAGMANTTQKYKQEATPKEMDDLKKRLKIQDLGNVKQTDIDKEVLNLKSKISDEEAEITKKTKDTTAAILAQKLAYDKIAIDPKTGKRGKLDVDQLRLSKTTTDVFANNDQVELSKLIQIEISKQTTKEKKLIESLERKLIITERLKTLESQSTAQGLNVKINDAETNKVKVLTEETKKLNQEKQIAKGSTEQLTKTIEGHVDVLKKDNLELQKNSITQKKVEGQNKAFGDTFGKIRDQIMLATGGVAIFQESIQLLRTSINIVRDLDKSFVDIAIVTEQTRSEVWKTFDSFAKLSTEYSVTMRDLVAGSTLFYQQGLKTSDVLLMTEASTIAAALGGVTMSKAADTLTAAIQGYSMEASGAMEITDKMAVVGAYSAANFNELSLAMEKVASSAYTAGVDFDHLMGYLGKMIETTREAPANIGTSMKTIIGRINEIKADPAKALEDGTDFNRVETALKSMGLGLRDINGEMIDTQIIFDQMGEKWNSLGRDQKAYLATVVAGARQQSRFLALMNDYDRTLELVRISQNSAGAALSQYETYSTGAEAGLKRLIVQQEIFSKKLIGSEGLTTALQLGEDFLALINMLPPSIALVGVAFVAYSAKLLIFNREFALATIGMARASLMAKTTGGVVMGMNMAFRQTVKESGLVAASLGWMAVQLTYVRDTAIKATASTRGFSAAIIFLQSALKTTALGLVKLLANPYVLAAIAIGTLVTLIYKHSQAEKKATEAKKQYLKGLEETAKKELDNANVLEANVKRYEELITILNRTSQEEEELLNVKKEIINNSPELLDSIDAEGELQLKNIEILKQRTEALKEQARASENFAIMQKLEAYGSGLEVPMGDTSKKMFEDFKKSSGGENEEVTFDGIKISLKNKSVSEIKKEIEKTFSKYRLEADDSITDLGITDPLAKQFVESLDKIEKMMNAEVSSIYKGQMASLTKNTIADMKKTHPRLSNGAQDMAYAITESYTETLTAGLNSEEAAQALKNDAGKIQELVIKALESDEGTLAKSFERIQEEIDKGVSFNTLDATIEKELQELVDNATISEDQKQIIKSSWMKALDIEDVGKKIADVLKALNYGGENSAVRDQVKENFNGFGTFLGTQLVRQIELMDTSEAKTAYITKINGIFEGMGSQTEQSLNKILQGADLSTASGKINTTLKMSDTLKGIYGADSTAITFDLAKTIIGDIPQEALNGAWVEQVKKLRGAIESTKTLKEDMLKGALQPENVEALMGDIELPDFSKYVSLTKEGAYDVSIQGLMYLDEKQQENYKNQINRNKKYFQEIKESTLLENEAKLKALETAESATEKNEEYIGQLKDEMAINNDLINRYDVQIDQQEKLASVNMEKITAIAAAYTYLAGTIEQLEADYDVATAAIEEMNSAGEISLETVAELLAANIEYANFITISEQGIATLKGDLATFERQNMVDTFKQKMQIQSDEITAEITTLEAKAKILQQQITLQDQALADGVIKTEEAKGLETNLNKLASEYNAELMQKQVGNQKSQLSELLKANAETYKGMADQAEIYFRALSAEGSVDEKTEALRSAVSELEVKAADAIKQAELVANPFAIEEFELPKGLTEQELTNFYKNRVENDRRWLTAIETEIEALKEARDLVDNMNKNADAAVMNMVKSDERVAAALEAVGEDAEKAKKYLEMLTKAAEDAAEVLQKLADIEKDFIEKAKGLKFDFVTPFISNLQSMIDGIDDYMKGFDKFYNYVRKMDRVEIQQGIVEGLTQSPLLKGEDYLQGINAQIGLVIGKSAIRVDYIGSLREDLEEQQDMIKEKYGEYYNFDLNGEIYLDYPNLESDIDEVMTDAFSQVDELKQQVNAKEMESSRLGGQQSANDLLLGKAKSELETITAAQQDVLNNEELMKTPEGQGYVAQYNADITRLTASVAGYTTVADGYNASLDATNTELEALNYELGAMEDGLSQKEEYISDMTDAADTYAETYARLQEQIQGFIEDQAELIELRQQIIQMAISTEQEVYDALVETRQKEIDDKKKKYDEYKKMDQQYLETVRKIIEEERALRDKDKSAFDLQQKQKRAALLGRDTSGAYGAELAALQKEISTDRQALYDKQVDERVDSLEDEINSRQELMDKELEMLQSALDYYKENTQLLWQEVAALMNDGADSVMAVLEGTATYMNGSELQRQVAREGWEKNVQISIDAVTTSWLAQIDNMIEGYQTMIDEFPEVVQALEEAEEGFGGAGETLLENMANFTDQWQSVVDEAVNATGGTFQQAAADIDAAVASMVASFRMAQAAFSASNADLVTSTIEKGTGSVGGNPKPAAEARADAARAALAQAPRPVEGPEGEKDWSKGSGLITEQGINTRYTWFMNNIANRPETGPLSIPRSVKDLFWEIVVAGYEWNSLTPPAKPYKEGGLVNYTGLAQVHGSTSSPEAFLSSSDTANIAELTKILREIKIPTFTIPSTSSNAIMNGGGQVFDFDDININVNIAKVDNDVDLKELEKVVEQTVLNTLTAKVVNNVGRRF